MGAGREAGAQRVRRVVAFEACARCGPLHGPRHRPRRQAVLGDAGAVHEPEERSIALVEALQPALERPHGTERWVVGTRHLGRRAVPELILLAAPHLHAQAVRLHFDVGAVELHELARAKRAGESEQQKRSIPIIARGIPERGHQLREFWNAKRRGTFLSRSVGSADPSLQ